MLIPYSEADIKEFRARRKALIEKLEAESDLMAGLLAQSKRIIASGKTAVKEHARVSKEHDDIIKMIEGTVKDTKKMKKGVDIAWTIATLGRNLGGLAKTAKTASTATGKALKEANKEAQKQAVGIMKGPIEGQAKTAGTKYLLNEKNDISMLGMVVGAVSEAQDKMMSPAFWFHASVQMWDDPSIDTWIGIAQGKWEQDAKNKVYVVSKQKIVFTKKLMLQAQQATATAKKIQEEVKKSQKRTNDISGELSAIPVL